MLSPNPRIRAIAEVVVGAVALLAFAATSPPPSEPEPEPDPTDPDIEVPQPAEQTAAVVLHNALGNDAVIRLRRLAPAVDVECSAILEAPGALLTEALLGPTESWTIPSGDNLGLNATAGRTCEVLRIEGDGFAPRWAVWQPGTRVPQPFRPDETPEGPGVITLSPEGTGATLQGVSDLLFAPDDPARGLEQCAPVTDGQRVEWGDPLPVGGLLMRADWGPDGCGSVVFSADGETVQTPWYLCVPEASWPFAPGDSVTVQPGFGSGSESVELVANDDAGTLQHRLQVFRSSDAPAVDGLTLAYATDESCGYDVELGCGTVARVGQVQVSLPGVATPTLLAAGDVLDGITLPGSSQRTRIEVLAAQERDALDPECALGPDVLGPDLALVLTQTETETE